jgi:hypothetical protein
MELVEASHDFYAPPTSPKEATFLPRGRLHLTTENWRKSAVLENVVEVTTNATFKKRRISAISYSGFPRRVCSLPANPDPPPVPYCNSGFAESETRFPVGQAGPIGLEFDGLLDQLCVPSQRHG